MRRVAEMMLQGKVVRRNVVKLLRYTGTRLVGGPGSARRPKNKPVMSQQVFYQVEDNVATVLVEVCFRIAEDIDDLLINKGMSTSIGQLFTDQMCDKIVLQLKAKRIRPTTLEGIIRNKTFVVQASDLEFQLFSKRSTTTVTTNVRSTTAWFTGRLVNQSIVPIVKQFEFYCWNQDIIEKSILDNALTTLYHLGDSHG